MSWRRCGGAPVARFNGGGGAQVAVLNGGGGRGEVSGGFTPMAVAEVWRDSPGAVRRGRVIGGALWASQSYDYMAVSRAPSYARVPEQPVPKTAPSRRAGTLRLPNACKLGPRSGRREPSLAAMAPAPLPVKAYENLDEDGDSFLRRLHVKKKGADAHGANSDGGWTING